MTFSDIASIDNVMLIDDHEIEGKTVECKKAVPKESQGKEAIAAPTPPKP